MTPPEPAPAPVPDIEALQATLGQFMGTMSEVVTRLVDHVGAHLGTGPRRQAGSNLPALEGVGRRLVSEMTQRKPVDLKRYDGEGCPWEDYLIHRLESMG